MQVPASIFKAYDIRGIVGETLTADIVYDIGRAVASLALQKGERTVYVGYDGRLSSPLLAEALQQGLLASGVDVIALGMVTTPMLYFAAHQHPQCHSGVMITGSHNPPPYNGLKMVVAGETLSSSAIQQLYTSITQQAYTTTGLRGQLRTLDIYPDYQAAIV
ncbi:MAG TPA: phosphomannomutase/phosphoglucomutase, partial [Methylophilus sp.]